MVRGETRQRGRKVWESEKPRVIGRRAVGPAGQGMTAGGLVASKEDHDFNEGKAL
jgi:hypothetical protein